MVDLGFMAYQQFQALGPYSAVAAIASVGAAALSGMGMALTKEIADQQEINKEQIKFTGKTPMKVRRYEDKGNGRVSVYYEDIEVKDTKVTGYYAGTSMRSQAPPGTTYEYLKCIKTWGFTEPDPDTQVSFIASEGMLEIANEILEKE